MPKNIADSIIKAYNNGCRVILIMIGLPTVDLRVIGASKILSSLWHPAIQEIWNDDNNNNSRNNKIIIDNSNNKMMK